MLKSRSVPSVLNQSYDFRLIIIGDCCNDDTEKVVNSFKDDRVIFLISKTDQKDTQKQSKTIGCWSCRRNKHGLKMVKGDWIARIDDDDIWEQVI